MGITNHFDFVDALMNLGHGKNGSCVQREKALMLTIFALEDISS
jgi:hypothetical protein